MDHLAAQKKQEKQTSKYVLRSVAGSEKDVNRVLSWTVIGAACDCGAQGNEPCQAWGGQKGGHCRQRAARAGACGGENWGAEEQRAASGAEWPEGGRRQVGTGHRPCVTSHGSGSPQEDFQQDKDTV